MSDRLRGGRGEGGAAGRGTAPPTTPSSSWRRRCRARSRRRCWCASSPSRCARSRRPARRCCGSADRRWCTPARRPAMVALVEAGFVDTLFAGNALATHDIESALYGTSLGVDLSRGRGRRARPRAPHPGHQHHPRLRVDRRGGGAGRADLRRHARDGAGRQEVRAGRLRARRRPAARRDHRRDRRPARDAGRAGRTPATRSWSRRCCTASPPGTSCPRRSRWSAWTSTRRR